MSYIIDGFGQADRTHPYGKPGNRILNVGYDPGFFPFHWRELWQWGCLRVLCSATPGFPAGKRSGPLWKRCLRFPRSSSAFLVYLLLSKRGPAGELGLLFTLPGIAIGQTILGLPIVAALTATAVESLDRRLAPTLLTLGARKKHLLLTSLWEARFAVLIAGITAYGRIVSEVGISMMVGGNIKWHTRTLTTTIALETGKGRIRHGYCTRSGPGRHGFGGQYFAGRAEAEDRTLSRPFLYEIRNLSHYYGSNRALHIETSCSERRERLSALPAQTEAEKARCSRFSDSWRSPPKESCVSRGSPRT